MPSKAVEAAINDQIAKEFYAAYLYLSMAAYFEDKNLPGFSHWMRLQHQEETGHAMKFFDFLLESGGKVKLQDIAKPPSTFKSPAAALDATLKHERTVTDSINALYELAQKEKHYPTRVLLQWFITEQTEEEKVVSDIIARLKLAGDNPSALLIIDTELGSRTAVG